MDIQKKRAEEKAIMSTMITLYCRGQKHVPQNGTLCSACAELLSYAAVRTERCPRMEHKSFCSKCPTPCYQPGQKERIKAVMRYAGPRMLLRHPLLVLKHMLPAKPHERRKR